MLLSDFFSNICEEVAQVFDDSFEVEVTKTRYVPSFGDPSITYDNFDTKKKKCKLLESCVLFVDIRNSVQLSNSKPSAELAKIYTLFVKSVIKCSKYHGGHVRNVEGDRVMVVFDRDSCFKKALDTAVLINSVTNNLLKKAIDGFDFRCGIGIDYGKMLIAKGGEIRHGEEKEFYRSLSWLGEPANIAARLTDLANKVVVKEEVFVRQGNYYESLEEWLWLDVTYDKFLDDLEPVGFGNNFLRHKDNYFRRFFKSRKLNRVSRGSPILITERVFQGLNNENPDCDYIKEDYFKEVEEDVKDYEGKFYGADVVYSIVNLY
ncbi:hypothetical protein DYI26_20460 [Halomonas litopenaei]|nr:hypothetical protein [Halomonas litopenaei]